MIALSNDRNDAMVPKLRFSTESSHGADAFELWQQRIAGYFDSIAPPSDDLKSFRSEASSWHFGELIATHGISTAREQIRTAKKIRADQIDHYRVTLQLSGTLRIDADGRRVQVLPGQMLVTDMSRPKRYTVEAGEQVLVIVPRGRLDAVLPRALDLHGVVPQGASAAILAMQLRSVLGQADALMRTEGPFLSQAMLHMIAASVSQSALPLADEARVSVEKALLRQICLHIDRHLQDEGLTPATLAAQFRLSRATLYRMFEPIGGVAGVIKDKRMAHMHGLLATPDRRHHLSVLAESHGFSDASALSRAFKRHFGYGPSDVRPQRLNAPDASPTSAESTVGDWMRTIRG